MIKNRWENTRQEVKQDKTREENRDFKMKQETLTTETNNRDK